MHHNFLHFWSYHIQYLQFPALTDHILLLSNLHRLKDKHYYRLSVRSALLFQWLYQGYRHRRFQNLLFPEVSSLNTVQYRIFRLHLSRYIRNFSVKEFHILPVRSYRYNRWSGQNIYCLHNGESYHLQPPHLAGYLHFRWHRQLFLHWHPLRSWLRYISGNCFQTWHNGWQRSCMPYHRYIVRWCQISYHSADSPWPVWQ